MVYRAMYSFAEPEREPPVPVFVQLNLPALLDDALLDDERLEFHREELELELPEVPPNPDQRELWLPTLL